MSFEQIKDLVLVESGRTDLTVKRVGTQTAIDFYVNEGSRWLDLQQEVRPQYKSLTLEEGTIRLLIPLCRSVDSIYRIADDAMVKLVRINIDEAISRFPKGGNSDHSTSVVWTDQAAWPAGTPDPKSLPVTILPPPDSDLSLAVFGAFHSEELSDDDDTNYWVSNYPRLLALASLWTLESANRNREGMADYEASMAPYLRGIDVDLAESNPNELLGMNG